MIFRVGGLFDAYDKNFNVPYFSANIQEFWKRWHISLGTWFRDYVYIPMGGSRVIQFRWIVNMLVVWTLTGIWHGANITFIIWGLSYCILLIVEKMIINKIKINRVLKTALTFTIVSILWVIFRAESVQQAMEIYNRLFVIDNGVFQPYMWTFVGIIIMAEATLAAYKKSKDNKQKNIEGFYPIQDLTKIRGQVIFFSACMLTFMFAYIGESYFIYGNF